MRFNKHAYFQSKMGFLLGNSGYSFIKKLIENLIDIKKGEYNVVTRLQSPQVFEWSISFPFEYSH